MEIKKEPLRELYLADTSVENIFINEYMAAAPGDYVKVYLFALMCAEQSQFTDHEEVARQCNIDIEDVLKAWTYWEECGVIKKHIRDPKNPFVYDLEFKRLKVQLYYPEDSAKEAAKQGDKRAGAALEDGALKEMYRSIEGILGRLLGGKEPAEILSWVTDLGAEPSFIVAAYTYAVKTMKKEKAAYVRALIKEWKSKGLSNPEELAEYLKINDERHYIYRRIFKALGFSRMPSEKEKSLMDTWIDTWNFSIEQILEACGKTSGIPNPNINYVNKVLENWKNEEGGSSVSGQNQGAHGKAPSMNEAKEYYAYLRAKAETDGEKRRAHARQLAPLLVGIEEEIRQCSFEISRAMISQSLNKEHSVNRLKNKAEALIEEQKRLLQEQGLPLDYLEIKYNCPLCEDTGITDTGERCSCFSKVMNEAREWKNS